MHITQIIKHPILTEKNYTQMGDGYYTFEVAREASKLDIKRAFETIFEVKVASVNVLIYKPHTKRVGRFSGRTKTYKKAVIKLQPGQKLDVFNAQAQK